MVVGSEYGTNKETLKGSLDEADRLADVHLGIKDRLLNDVQTEVKEWKNENFKKQMVGGCKEAKTFEDDFRKVRGRIKNVWICVLSRVQDYLDSKTRYRNYVITFWVITPLKRNAPF